MNSHQPLAIIQPVQLAIAHAIQFPVLQHRAFPVAQGESLATCSQSHRVSLRMQVVAIEITGG